MPNHVIQYADVSDSIRGLLERLHYVREQAEKGQALITSAKANNLINNSNFLKDLGVTITLGDDSVSELITKLEGLSRPSFMASVPLATLQKHISGLISSLRVPLSLSTHNPANRAETEEEIACKKKIQDLFAAAGEEITKRESAIATWNALIEELSDAKCQYPGMWASQKESFLNRWQKAKTHMSKQLSGCAQQEQQYERRLQEMTVNINDLKQKHMINNIHNLLTLLLCLLAMVAGYFFFCISIVSSHEQFRALQRFPFIVLAALAVLAVCFCVVRPPQSSWVGNIRLFTSFYMLCFSLLPYKFPFSRQSQNHQELTLFTWVQCAFYAVLFFVDLFSDKAIEQKCLPLRQEERERELIYFDLQKAKMEKQTLDEVYGLQRERYSHLFQQPKPTSSSSTNATPNTPCRPGRSP